MSFLHANRWIWRMAWRDSRRSRRRLLLYSASIVLGIAALAAIASFAKQIEHAIEQQAKGLLGADLVIAAREPFTEEQEATLKTLGIERAREVSFSSMVLFPKNQSTRLVQVRALEGNFPFYGQLETVPASAAVTFRKEYSALADEGLMNQFGVAVGDSIKVGELVLPVSGVLRKVPGQTVAFSTLAPVVYIPMDVLDRTRLLAPGSLARYRVYFRFEPAADVESLVREMRPMLERNHWNADTVEERKRDLGRAMTNLYHFLNLVALIAVLLGGIGVASAMHVHVKEKLGHVAILRCLGCSAWKAFAVYLAQGLALGIVGAFLGGLLGIVVQAALSRVVGDFLPVQLDFEISWLALLRGMMLGLGISVVFTLLPLLSIRHISPLAALRVSAGTDSNGRTDPLRWVCLASIIGGLIYFSISQSRRWTHGLAFAGALVLAFGLLAAVAQLVIWLTRHRVPPTWPFVLRQGLANVHRPNNRTLLLMVALGLGTFLILTLQLTQNTLVREIIPSENSKRANAVLFDIQPDQKEGVEKLLREHSLPVLQQAPIVTMRLASVKGEPVDALAKQKGSSIPRWALRREYRSTYRDELVDSEKLIRGTWVRRSPGSDVPVPVSVEEGIARNLKVDLGDELVFDVQGVPIKTVISSVREVDWRRLQPNFFVVFPLGILEQAPAFHVLVTRVPSAAESARLQREVVTAFPNVSTIDLTLVLTTVDAILSKISFAIRFMALFSVGTGLLVMAAAVLTGRYQRVQESVLLRTLGASRAQIQAILRIEYFLLGLFASFTGVALSLGAAWALAVFVFAVNFRPSYGPIVAALIVVPFLTTLIGLATSRGVHNRPPLEILRTES